MIEMKFLEKYKGIYLKDFETMEECTKYCNEHYEIMHAWENKNGTWESV